MQAFQKPIGQKKMENLDDHGYPKTQEPVELVEQNRSCSSYPFRHKPINHCAERIAKMFGECTMQHLMF